MDPVASVAQVFDDALRGLDPGRLLVAFSGGLDSTALLLLARRYATARGLPLGALHVNHAAHPEAGAWEGHCRSVCRRLEVPLQVERPQPGSEPTDSSEAALRDLRYTCFVRVMQASDLLLTAHHRDDVAETLLLNLLRGAGLEGLAAVPARRPLGLGAVARPLLAIARADLEPVVEQAGLAWIEDPSNQDTRRRRNFIRHRALPLLKERWPGATTTIARAATLSREAAELLDESLTRELEPLRTPDPAAIALDRLRRFSAARQRALLRLWLRELGIVAPPRARLAELVRQLGCARADAQPRARFGGVELRRYRELLYARRPVPPLDPATEVKWSSPRVELPAGAGTLEWLVEDGAALSAEPPELTVRFSTNDKCLKPAGRRHRRPLRLLFQEAGLPPWERPRCPLIFSGQRLLGLGDLCWTDEFEAIQRRLGARYRWRRAPWRPVRQIA